MDDNDPAVEATYIPMNRLLTETSVVNKSWIRQSKFRPTGK